MFQWCTIPQIIKKIEDLLNSGDPEVRKWFLVKQIYLPFLLSGFYALFSVAIGPALMRNRKPFELRKIMVIFNFSIVATYLIAGVMAVNILTQVSLEQFCYGAVVKEGDITYLIATTGWIIYLVKYVEFLDTVFFILRKKENHISFLHILHHSTVPVLGWILLRTEKSGLQVIPVMANGMVHIIMYTYYGLAAMGPGIRKYLWWKKYLTQIQIIQFLFIILFVTVLAPLSGCTMLETSYAMNIFFSSLFLYLFYRFYKENFHSRKKSSNINGTVKMAPNMEEKNLTNRDENIIANEDQEILRNGKAGNHSTFNGKLKKEE